VATIPPHLAQIQLGSVAFIASSSRLAVALLLCYTVLSMPKTSQKPDEPEFRRVTTIFTSAQWRKLREYALAENTSLQAIVVESVIESMARKGVKLP
jgi:hypothetical protein